LLSFSTESSLSITTSIFILTKLYPPSKAWRSWVIPLENYCPLTNDFFTGHTLCPSSSITFNYGITKEHHFSIYLKSQKKYNIEQLYRLQILSTPHCHKELKLLLALFLSIFTLIRLVKDIICEWCLYLSNILSTYL